MLSFEDMVTVQVRCWHPAQIVMTDNVESRNDQLSRISNFELFGI